MNYHLKDKVALVTGAGAGMGLATAQAFAAEGAAIVLADINEDAVQEAAARLAAAGRKALAVTCDVADEEQVKAMVDRIVAVFGRLDAAFNNAGIQSAATDIADTTPEEFDRINDVNLRGVWSCMKHELAQMRRQGSGTIVNNSSIGGLIGLPGRSLYHGAKHGVLGLTKSAAMEYAARGIRINAICPGVIETPMVESMLEKEPGSMAEILKLQPIGRLGRAQEIADAVLWLCSPGSSFVIGHALVVDGGFTIH
jgi:NAD(P)-dependent dehydrogenase (short-subunit alcohol dehydrogenase family)